MIRTALWHSIPGIALAVLVLVPFRDKAFTIDDTLFLLEAQHVIVDPLHPTAFEMVWFESPQRGGLPSGPVMAWLLVPSVLAGGAEWVAHLAQLAMLALAIAGTVALALRLGLTPPWAMASGLLLASTPAVMGMAGTAMADVPAMALGVIGLERLVAWSQEGRAWQAILASVALGLAPLARSHLALLLGIGALLMIGHFLEKARWRMPAAKWLPLAAAPLLSAALLLLMRDPHPDARGLVAATGLHSGLSYVAPNAVAFPIHWVLAFPLAIPLILLRPRAVIARWWVVAVASGAAALVVGMQRRPFGFAVLAAIGAAVLWEIGADAWARRDSLQLALGLWLLVALVAVPYVHLPAKYLLASAPAAAILVAREMATSSAIRARMVLGLTCVLGIATGIAILRADAAFADLGRRAARELIAPPVAAGERVWFVGHWGFQWYAERAGGRHVTITPPYPAPGDLLVLSRNTDRGGESVRTLLSSYPPLALVGYLGDSRPGGRLMDTALGAGFFSNQWGYLPWAWGDDVLDEFGLFRIGHADVRAPGQGAPVR